MKKLIISHSADWDGLMSAAIIFNNVLKTITSTDSICTRLFNYGDDEKPIIENIKDSDIVKVMKMQEGDIVLFKFNV